MIDPLVATITDCVLLALIAISTVLKDHLGLKKKPTPEELNLFGKTHATIVVLLLMAGIAIRWTGYFDHLEKDRQAAIEKAELRKQRESADEKANALAEKLDGANAQLQTLRQQAGDAIKHEKITSNELIRVNKELAASHAQETIMNERLAATREDLKITNDQLFSANERLEFVQVELEYSKAREATLESLLESIRDPSKEFPLEIAHLEFPIPIPPIYALPADEKPGEYPTRFYIPRRDGTFYQLVCSKNCYWQSAGTNILELRRVPTYPGIDLNRRVVGFGVNVVINGQPVGAPATLIVDDKEDHHHEIPYPQSPVPRLPVRAPRG